MTKETDNNAEILIGTGEYGNMDLTHEWVLAGCRGGRLVRDSSKRVKEIQPLTLRATPQVQTILGIVKQAGQVRYEVTDKKNRCSAFLPVHVRDVQSSDGNITIHLDMKGRPGYWGTGEGFAGDRYSEWAGEESPEAPSGELRRDQRAHAAELAKVREIALCFCLVDESNETDDPEAGYELKKELTDRLANVLWRYHQIPAMNMALGTVKDAEAEKARARAAGHALIHVPALDAGPETHAIEITLWLMHQGSMSSAAILRRMFRLEPRTDGTEAAVETVAPMVRSALWERGKTGDAEAMEDATRELIEATLDQITKLDPTIGSSEGV